MTYNGTAAIAGGAEISASFPATAGTVTFPAGSNAGPRQKQWSALALGNVGDYIGSADAQNAAVQIEGVFGANGAVVIEGSLDGQNIETLKDQSGNPLRITSRGIYQVGSLPAQFRPNVTGGDATTSLTITALVRPVV